MGQSIDNDANDGRLMHAPNPPPKPGENGSRPCVYTCLFGGYEALNEQPVAHRSDLDFICFTDDPGLTSRTWRIQHVPARFPLDSVRSQRAVKLLAHEYLSDRDISLYVDNSIILQDDPADFIAAHLGADDDIAIAGHSFRNTIADEFMEILRLGYDDGARILEQLNHYSLTDPEALQETPFWTAVMIRRHHAPPVADTMRLWLDHVLRYSRRDQVSLSYVLRRTGLKVRRIALDNFASALHRWPVTPQRDRNAIAASHGNWMPPDVLAGALSQERAALNRRIAELEAALETKNVREKSGLPFLSRLLRRQGQA